MINQLIVTLLVIYLRFLMATSVGLQDAFHSKFKSEISQLCPSPDAEDYTEQQFELFKNEMKTYCERTGNLPTIHLAYALEPCKAAWQKWEITQFIDMFCIHGTKLLESVKEETMNCIRTQRKQYIHCFKIILNNGKNIEGEENPKVSQCQRKLSKPCENHSSADISPNFEIDQSSTEKIHLKPVSASQNTSVTTEASPIRSSTEVSSSVHRAISNFFLIILVNLLSLHYL